MLFVAVFTVISALFLIKGRRCFLMYFVALYPILPDYFGVELGAGLPLLKASRILLILLFIAVVAYEKKVEIFPKQKIINSQMYVGIFIYFLCRIIANGYYVVSFSEAINAEFSVIIEQFLLMVLLLQMIKNENEIIQMIDVMVKVSGIIAIISFINIAIGQNLFNYLKTIDRNVMMSSIERIGMIRADATFGHPVYYSVYTILMLPLALYLYQNKKETKYLILMLINIVALLLTGTRGTIAVLFFFIIVAFIKMERKEKEKFAIILFVLILFVVIISLIDFGITKYFSSIIQSVFSAFGLSDATIDNFGGNYSTGLDSRWVQLSAFSWLFQNNPIFGLGAGCQNRGTLYYYVNSHWRKTDTIDNGYVGYVAQEGLLGITAIAALHFSLIKSSFTMAVKERRKKKSGLANMFFLCFIVYVGEMLSIADSSQLFWIIITLYVSYRNTDEQPILQRRKLNE